MIHGCLSCFMMTDSCHSSKSDAKMSQGIKDNSTKVFDHNSTPATEDMYLDIETIYFSRKRKALGLHLDKGQPSYTRMLIQY